MTLHQHHHQPHSGGVAGLSSTAASRRRLDQTLATGLVTLLILYLVLTMGTFLRISSDHTKSLPRAFFERGKQQTAAALAAAAAASSGDHSTTNVAAATPVKKQLKVVPPPPGLSLPGKAAGNMAVASAASLVAATTGEQQQQLQMQQQQQQRLVAGPTYDKEGVERVRHTFPVHVGNDVEVIEHPGFHFVPDKEASIRKANEQRHLEGQPPLTGTMMVPKFWNPPEYGGDVRQYLGQHGDRLMTVDEALSIGSFWGGYETIYISIASYRDPECRMTLESIYARAKVPNRIRLAVIDQIIDEDPKCIDPITPCDEDPSQSICKFGHLVNYYQVDARLGVGPVFARHLAHRFYRGEYFAMQVDAHVRFVQDWDEDLVGQWQSAHNEMAILTTYLSDLNNSIEPGTHKGIHPGRPIMCRSDYEGDGKYKHLRHGQQPEGPPGIHGTPTLHPFWAAGFSFARGHFVAQVPYDQYLPMVFQGEEISMGLRAFTYGYDFYAAERSTCYHMYAIGGNADKRKKINLFWENNLLYAGAGLAAMKRLNGIIGMDTAEYDHAEEQKYGLGKVRTTKKFFDTFGIHTETQTVEHHLCQFVGKPMQHMFIPHLREDHMGINYDEIDYQWKDPHPEIPDPNMGIQRKKEVKKRAARVKEAAFKK